MATKKKVLLSIHPHTATNKDIEITTTTTSKLGIDIVSVEKSGSSIDGVEYIITGLHPGTINIIASTLDGSYKSSNMVVNIKSDHYIKFTSDSGYQEYVLYYDSDAEIKLPRFIPHVNYGGIVYNDFEELYFSEIDRKVYKLSNLNEKLYIGSNVVNKFGCSAFEDYSVTSTVLMYSSKAWKVVSAVDKSGSQVDKIEELNKLLTDTGAALFIRNLPGCSFEGSLFKIVNEGVSRVTNISYYTGMQLKVSNLVIV